jgi:uncharacterized iron-regulated membrane protein
MRQIHRWISIVAAVFLLIVATTGVILQVQRLTGEDKDRDRDAPKALAIAADAYAPMFARTLEVARARAPDQPVASIALQLAGDEPQGVVTFPGDPGRQITVDARDGKVLKDEKYEAESLVLRIHSGEILGEPGVVLGVFWGSALVLLSLTGIWVYLELYRRRRKASGKSRLFW